MGSVEEGVEVFEGRCEGEMKYCFSDALGLGRDQGGSFY